MGILFGKERIIDTILTQEGRNQLAEGGLKATFVSFTDSSAIYDSDTIVSGGLQAVNRFVLEATNRVQDQITISSNEQGLLETFVISDSSRFPIRQGQILSSSNGNDITPVSASQFTSMAASTISSSIDNFKNLYILKSPDPLNEQEKQFLIGPKEVSFSITPTNPTPEGGIKQACVDNIESLFYDKKLSHIPNFAFMPPVNSSSESGIKQYTSLGNFVNLNQESMETYEHVEEMLNDMYSKGYGTVINFTETSKENNVFCQMFELSNGEIAKLEVIDFGQFATDSGTKHVLFAGKVYTDSQGSETFVNIFTLVFEN